MSIASCSLPLGSWRGRVDAQGRSGASYAPKVAR